MFGCNCSKYDKETYEVLQSLTWPYCSGQGKLYIGSLLFHKDLKQEEESLDGEEGKPFQQEDIMC